MNPIKSMRRQRGALEELEVLAIAVLIALVVGAAGGWFVNGWRLSGDLKEQKGIVATQNQSIETLKGANKNCTAGVAEVKDAVKSYVADSDARSAAAAAAMKKAAQEAKGHMDAVKEAMNRPPAPPGKECDTAAKEATDYAKKRKEAK